MSDSSLMNADAQFYSELMRAYFDSTDDAIFVLCDEMKFLACNRATERWLGRSEQDLTRHNQRRPITELLGEDYDAERFSACFRRALKGESVSFETCIRPDPALKRWVEINISRVNIEAGRMVIAVARDISERKKHLATIDYQQHFDALTELPCRNSLIEHLDNYPQDSGQSLTLFALDLDRFKEINESLGQQLGDSILQEVARRLQRLTDSAEGDFLARLGGDEFALATPGITMRQAYAIAHRIHKAIAKPFAIDNGRIGIDCGIGIAVWPRHADHPGQLIQCAEAAMYTAKSEKAGMCVYDASVSQTSAQRLQLVSDLREAINAAAIRPHYQPIVSMRDKTIHVEALARWRHPQQGYVSLEAFIHLAEETGMIGVLTSQIINAAFQECAGLLNSGAIASLSVNISAYCLSNTLLVSEIRNGLKKHHIKPASITLELTESAIMSTLPDARATLDDLHNLGVNFSIDDFGTGYSSLSKLKQMTLKELKIDKSFIMDLLNNENDVAITRATIDMAHALGLQVVAEGIENQATWRRLQAMGCDYGQGFWLCEPMPIDALRLWQGLAA